MPCSHALVTVVFEHVIAVVTTLGRHPVATLIITHLLCIFHARTFSAWGG